MKGLGSEAILGYCTNVHPTANAQEILRMIRTDCSRVKSQVDPSINFGIGLWLSAASLREFQDPELLESFRNECRDSGLRPFSWNAFPYLNFHQESVKERVYLPNWTEKARLGYTLDLMSFIAKLGLSQGEVSISTLPVAGRVPPLNDSELGVVVENLLEVIIRSVEIEEANGLSIHLDLEPEPYCFLETSQDVVRFFQEYLLPRGIPRLEKLLGVSRSAAEQMILNKIRVCYDTCHAAVMFESPGMLLGNYGKLGIRIGKVQVSSGLVYRPDGAGSSQALLKLQELSLDRYLHQVYGRDASGKVEFYSDLSEALQAWGDVKPALEEYRIHYHVPVFLKQLEILGTTQNHILELFQLAKTRDISHHWEVETYTWSVLPPSFIYNFEKSYRDKDSTGSPLDEVTCAGENLAGLIAHEINWVNQMTQGG